MQNRPKTVTDQPRTKKYKNKTLKKVSPNHYKLAKVPSDNRFWKQEKQQIKVYRDIKSIPLIFAYKPQQLHHSLVKNPKLYLAFFGKLREPGLGDLYLKPILQHFKEWRKNIRSKLISAFEIVIGELDLQKDGLQEKIVKMLSQIRQINKELKEGITSLMENVAKSQVRSLLQSFQYTEDYINRMISVIQNIFCYSHDIHSIACKMDQLCLDKKIQKQLNKAKKKYEKTILEILTYSLSHPQSAFFNGIQLRIKFKFDIISRQALQASKQIGEFQNIKQNLIKLQQKHTKINQQLTKEVLQEICEGLLQIDNLMLINSKNNQKQNNKFIRNKQSKEKVEKIIQEIKKIELQFLSNLKQRIQNLFVDQYCTLQKIKILNLIHKKGEQFKSFKKKLIIVCKIFRDRLNMEYFFQKCSNCIKKISPSIQQIQQINDQIFKKISDRKKHQKLQFNQKLQLLSEIKNLTENYEKQKRIILGQLLNRLHLPLPPKQQKQNDSQMLKKLVQIISYSQRLSKDFSMLTISPLSESQSNDDIFKTLTNHQKKVKNINGRFLTKNLQQILQMLTLYKQCRNTELGDLLLGQKRNQFILGFKNIQKINQFRKTSLKIQKSDQVEQSINFTINSYKSQIEKVQKLQNGSPIISYFWRMLEEHLLYLCQLEPIQNIIFHQINSYSKNKYELLNKQELKYSYKYNLSNQGLISQFYKKTQTIVKCLQGVEDHVFLSYIRLLGQQTQEFIKQQKLFCELQKENNCFYPSTNQIFNLASQSFKFHLVKQLQKEPNSQGQLKKIFLQNNIKLDANLNNLSKLISQQKKRTKVDKMLIKQLQKIQQSIKKLQKCQALQYNETLDKMTNYLRTANLPHVGVFSKNKIPIVLLPSKIQMLYQILEQIFQVKSGTISGIEGIMIYDFKEIMKSDISDIALGLQSQKKSIIKEKHLLAKDLIGQKQNYADDEIEEIVEIIDNNIIQQQFIINDGSFIKQNVIHEQSYLKDQKTSFIISKNQRTILQPERYSYYLISSIQNAQDFAKALHYPYNIFHCIFQGKINFERILKNIQIFPDWKSSINSMNNLIKRQNQQNMLNSIKKFKYNRQKCLRQKRQEEQKIILQRQRLVKLQKERIQQIEKQKLRLALQEKQKIERELKQRESEQERLRLQRKKKQEQEIIQREKLQRQKLQRERLQQLRKQLQAQKNLKQLQQFQNKQLLEAKQLEKQLNDQKLKEQDPLFIIKINQQANDQIKKSQVLTMQMKEDKQLSFEESSGLEMSYLLTEGWEPFDSKLREISEKELLNFSYAFSENNLYEPDIRIKLDTIHKNNNKNKTSIIKNKH